MKTWQKWTIGGVAVSFATYLLWRFWLKEENGNGMTQESYGNGYGDGYGNGYDPNQFAPDPSPYERPPGSGTPVLPNQDLSSYPGMPQAMDFTPGGISTPAGVTGADMAPMNPALLTNQSAVPSTLAGGVPQPGALASGRTSSRSGGEQCPPGMYWNDVVGGCMNE